MTATLTVRDVMTTQVVTVLRGTSFKQAATLFAARRISAAPVLDTDGRVIGLVSTADLVPKEAFQGRPPRLRSLLLHPEELALIEKSDAATVGELMTSPAVTIGPDASLTEAARLMLRHHIKRLPVVTATGRPLGILSRGDLLRAFLRPDSEIATAVRAELAEHLPEIDRDRIEVLVDDGTVTLEGEVPDARLTAVAARLARGVDGVVAVTDRLTAPADHRPSPPTSGPLF